jgi:MFS family permease
MASSPIVTPAAPGAGRKVPRELRGLFGWIVPANLSIYLFAGAVPGVLLPTQVTAIDANNDVANLAIVAGVGAFAAMVISPVAGIISDRTRSRFGRRTPLMVVGALVAGLALIGLGLQNGIVQLAITWAIVQIAVNFLISPLTAILPDRVPVGIRGAFATLFGIGMMVGGLAGQVLGSLFVTDIMAGYVLLAGVMIVGVMLFVIFARDSSSLDLEREPFNVKAVLRTFWVNPIAHPDFFWGFAGRMLLYTGYFIATGYQLYILRDYIGLADDAAASIPVLGIVSLLAIIVSTAVSGPWSDRVGRRRVFVFISAVLMAAALSIPMIMPTLVGMILFSLVSGLGFGIFQSVDTALMSQVLPSAETYGKDLGVLNIAATLPQTIGPVVGGAVVLAFGYIGIFPVGIVLVLAGGAAVYMIRSVR